MDGPIGRLFTIVALALAGATVAGMAILWPGDVKPRLGQGLVGNTERAEIQRIELTRCSNIGAQRCRDVTIRIETGRDSGERAVVRTGTTALEPEYDVGDAVRVTKTGAPPGAGPAYGITDFERRTPLLLLTLVFCLLVVAFGRLRGVLSLVGLGASLAVILLFVVPAILDGKPPLAVAVVGSFAVMLAAIPLAHGFGPKSLAAILGTAASLVLTVGLATVFTHLTHLTGLASEEAALLQTSGKLELQGLLLAGMVIGALGVLDDVTISQSSTVLALREANPSLRAGQLFRRAMGVGRDHLTATVNTLVLAYAGAALPLLLVFSSGRLGFLDAVTIELIAKEVVAMLVGSIGLIAAVPITTGLAAVLSVRLPAERLRGAEAHAH